MTEIPLLDSNHPEFPSPEDALEHPNGLLAAGGNLTPATLIEAYRRGIFPWYSAGQPLLWWSPNPRAVLHPEKLHVSRSLSKLIRQKMFYITTDQAFDQVIASCAAPRDDQAGTWITTAMQAAYRALRQLNIAHSLEVWRDRELAGGLYGLLIGGVFCGESMFSRHNNASKVALFYLTNICRHCGIEIIDCQIPNNHLARLGAEEMAREKFLSLLERFRDRPVPWPDNVENFCL